jgi:hypothetical protein
MPLDGAAAPFEVSKQYIDLGLKKGFNWQGDPIAALRTMREAVSKAIPKEELLAKGFTQSASAISGLTQYDLEQGARLLYPITTIFRNIIPRMTGGLGIQANWRSVTAVNPSRISIGLSEGHRGGAMAQTVTDNLAAFKTEGMDNFVTEQAYLAGLTFEDLYALATTTLLQGVMEAEELLDIGGNTSVALGTTATPATPSGSATGGGMSDGTYTVICVALTYSGMVRATVAGGIPVPYTRANMDGSSDPIQGFSAAPSAASASVTLNAGTSVQSFTTTVAAKTGAFGYAWYTGTGASSTLTLAAVTGYPAVTIKTNTGTQTVANIPAGDTSTSTLDYDGLLTQIVKSGSGAYVVDLAAQPLTTAGSGSGGLTEFNTLISDRIANYRLVPTDIFMSPTDHKAAASLILTGNTNLAPFFFSESSEGGLHASTSFKTYINPVGFGTSELEVHAHPFIPPGTAIFYSRENPYPLSNVPTLIRKLLRRDYWSVEWPVVTLQKTMGVYFDGVLQLYFPPAFGVITGIRASGT